MHLILCSNFYFNLFCFYLVLRYTAIRQGPLGSSFVSTVRTNAAGIITIARVSSGPHSSRVPPTVWDCRNAWTLKCSFAAESQWDARRKNTIDADTRVLIFPIQPIMIAFKDQGWGLIAWKCLFSCFENAVWGYLIQRLGLTKERPGDLGSGNPWYAWIIWPVCRCCPAQRAAVQSFLRKLQLRTAGRSLSFHLGQYAWTVHA